MRPREATIITIVFSLISVWLVYSFVQTWLLYLTNGMVFVTESGASVSATAVTFITTVLFLLVGLAYGYGAYGVWYKRKWAKSLVSKLSYFILFLGVLALLGQTYMWSAVYFALGGSLVYLVKSKPLMKYFI